MGLGSCPVDPAACAGPVLKGGASSFFGLLTSWIAASVGWVVHALAAALASTGGPGQVLAMSRGEFDVLVPVAPALLAIGLSAATIQALRHGDAGALWRTYLGVAPACVAGVALARPLARFVLAAVDEASAQAATGVAEHVAEVGRFFALAPAGTPGAADALLASLVVLGAILLWFELVLRTIALALLVVVVPLVVPLGAAPSLRRLGWRLAETFGVVAASKLLIVVTLALGLDELTTPSLDAVVTGIVTLLLATLSPFALLRLVPLMESTAVAGFEGMRQRAVRASGAPSASGLAARALAGEAVEPPPPTRPPDLGIPMWEGTAETPLPAIDPDAPRPAPPVGEPRVRTGHVVYQHDELGPVVGWHWDE